MYSKKIVFVGGGTLGHVLPMVPLVDELKAKYILYFIGTKKGLEKNYLQNNPKFSNGFKQTSFFDMQGLKRSLSLKNITLLFKYYRCCKQVKKYLGKIKPDLIIGMGGYISGVVVQIASKLKIKTIIHEQNSVLGLSNRLVSKKVDKLLLSFPIPTITQGIVVGNPRITEIKNNYISQEKDNTLLVVGGSRGSQVINDSILNLELEFVKREYKVILITGKKYFEENKDKINNLINKETIKILPFVNDLIPYLIQANVVISRSGATTLNEIMGLNKVSLLIPSINVTANHQEKNALILANNNAALMLKEKDLNKKTLIDAVDSLMLNYHLRKEIKSNLCEMSNFQSLYLFLEEVYSLL